MGPEVEVGPVEPERSLPLRHRVLRPHEDLATMTLPGSDDPEGVVIGAVDAETGEVLCTAAASPEEAPEDLAAVLPPGRQWRLRSMATDPAERSKGLGGRVLAAVAEHVRDHGGGVLWCSARVPAQRFYEREGFTPFGGVFEPPHIGPHVFMWRTIENGEADAGRK